MFTEIQRKRVDEIVGRLRKPWPSLSEADYREYIATQLAKPDITCDDLRLLCAAYCCNAEQITAKLAHDGYKGT